MRARACVHSVREGNGATLSPRGHFYFTEWRGGVWEKRVAAVSLASVILLAVYLAALGKVNFGKPNYCFLLVSLGLHPEIAGNRSLPRNFFLRKTLHFPEEQCTNVGILSGG